MNAVDPRMTGEDFVEVYDEPRHRFRFKNGFAYVYDVLIPPGEASLYHRHKEDTFYVSVESGASTTQERGKERVTMSGGAPGFSVCLCHRGKPLIHQVGNIGAEHIRLIGAEVWSSPAATSPNALSLPGHELVWETSRVRGYRITLEPGQTVADAAYDFSGLMVFVTDGCLATTVSGGAAAVEWKSAADWIWLDGPRRWTLSNAGSSPITAILGEWL